MTPMIDVVFLLLIFFICTTRFPEFEGKFDVRLPEPGPKRKAPAPQDIPDEVIVHVTADGQITVNEAAKTEEELARMLERLVAIAPKQAVVIAGEREALHKYVVRVLNACYRAGISDISFAALRR